MKKTVTALSFIFLILATYCLSMYFGNAVSPLEKEEKKFWVTKFLNDSRYPCIIAGDSRVFRGLDPAIISKNLETNCFNIGFDSSGFGPDLFDLIEKRLTVNQKRILIIAVSPHSFTERGAENNQLVEYIKMAPSEVTQLKNPTILDDLFPRISIDHLSDLFSKKEINTHELIQKHLSNGFAPGHQVRNDPAQAVASYQSLFKDHVFSERVQNALLEKLKMYRQKNISVYVLRLPISAELRQVEDQMSSFDEANFKKKLSEININWIDLPASGFETFDGSHLTDQSAQVVTEEVTSAILKLNELKSVGQK